MALVIRFAPLAGITALQANGRSYAVAGAATVDVPYLDAIAIGPDQATRLDIVGATTDRPVNVTGQVNWPPSRMYDSTLAAPIYLVPGSNPAQWKNISGSIV